MAVITVSARSGIAASGAAVNDTINITGKNETWKVAANKLSVPSSSITIKLANGNFAFLSTPDTVARNEPAAIPDFSSSTAYAKGQLVNKGGYIFTAKDAIAAGTWDITKWNELQPGSENQRVEYIRFVARNSGGASNSNATITLGGLKFYIFWSDKSIDVTVIKENSTATDRDYVYIYSTSAKNGETTATVISNAARLTSGSHTRIGYADVSSGKIVAAGTGTVFLTKTGGVFEISWACDLNNSTFGTLVVKYNGPALY